jgi:hypothetical protein
VSSENNWEPAKATPEQCRWVTVPGTSVRLQILDGWPAIIMAAVAADFNAYIEELHDEDSASWTPTNSVPTSNHLNGTAMDLNRMASRRSGAATPRWMRPRSWPARQV